MGSVIYFVSFESWYQVLDVTTSCLGVRSTCGQYLRDPIEP